ncbi:MAG: HAMP domain-containing histidine kinase [Oculatellaceae cyanobacterium Prado106]|jgi:signal transduction histidine kinase|nr:HAMP domain-containing histidine kinase [Oculatellaceae cyanobacterium Prado106]
MSSAPRSFTSPLRSLLHWLLHWGQSLLQSLQARPVSEDYQTWRQRFVWERLRLCLAMAIPCYVIWVATRFYEVFWQADQFTDKILRRFDATLELVHLWQQTMLYSSITVGLLLLGCLGLQRLNWSRRHPAVLFLCLSWSLTLAPQIVGSLLHFPNANMLLLIWCLVFLGQATLIPVRWQLHVLAQAGALFYFTGINSLLGMTTIANQSIYDLSMFIYLFWCCLIGDLAIYLYERLQRAEFDSQRDLRVFLHAVSHDLRTPVMGTSIVLKKLLSKATPGRVTVDRSVLERLLQGCDRQLSLIHSLQEAYESEVNRLVLHRQPLQLHTLVEAVLADLEPMLAKNPITLINRISPNLPPIEADATQLWRVYSNLITNALKHNPHGIRLILDAELVSAESRLSLGSDVPFFRHRQRFLDREASFAQPLPTAIARDPKRKVLRCLVIDNGVGIPAGQCDRLFELYARGARARYMPGLGLGLYLCRQIVQAHGGQIGVISDTGAGAMFWFTLPMSALIKEEL